MTQPLAPITEAQEARSRKIAAIHALAHWYAQNPDEPMPTNIIASSTTWPHEFQPEHDRVLAVTDFAHRHEAELTETWDQVTGRLTVAYESGMSVRIVRNARLDNNTPNRYVH